CRSVRSPSSARPRSVPCRPSSSGAVPARPPPRRCRTPWSPSSLPLHAHPSPGWFRPPDRDNPSDLPLLFAGSSRPPAWGQGYPATAVHRHLTSLPPHSVLDHMSDLPATTHPTRPAKRPKPDICERRPPYPQL